MKSVIVTTGATVPFIPLLSLFLDNDIKLKLLSLGYSRLVLQYGHAPESLVQELLNNRPNKPNTPSGPGRASSQGDNALRSRNKTNAPADLQIDGFSLVDNITSEIQKHDLVISHAGTGSILDALRIQKPLIIVVNPTLLHNHQLDIATELEQMGCLLGCKAPTKTELLAALDELKNKVFTQLPEPNTKDLQDIIYKEAGIII